MDRIGEPYVTHRRNAQRSGKDDGDARYGLGLGFFIAKTLLERSGARLALENQLLPRHGAIVRVSWGRADFERRPGSPSLEPATP
jgi:two-component system sensor histidine kinase RegB